MTAMSLADRPRPTLLLVRAILKGHLFAFVWLPRDELTTAPPASPSARCSRARSAARDHQLVGRARRRRPRADPLHAQYVDADAPTPDADGARPAARRDGARLGAGGRGRAGRRWSAPPRATRLALDLSSTLSPTAIAPAPPPRTAPRTSCACARSTDDRDRDVRLYRAATTTRRASCGSRSTAAAGSIPLSDAVPVLENFGFRVLEEVPTALDDGAARLHPRFPCSRSAPARPTSTVLDARRGDRARDRRGARAARPRTTSSTS